MIGFSSHASEPATIYADGDILNLTSQFIMKSPGPRFGLLVFTFLKSFRILQTLTLGSREALLTSLHRRPLSLTAGARWFHTQSQHTHTHTHMGSRVHSRPVSRKA